MTDFTIDDETSDSCRNCSAQLPSDLYGRELCDDCIEDTIQFLQDFILENKG